MEKEEQYVEDYFQAAKSAGDMFRMDPLIILAQGALESGWGTSHLAKVHHNFFGITTGSGKANAFWDGKKMYQAQNQYKLKFRSYESPSNGFKDFGRLIALAPIYKKAHAVAMSDVEGYAKAIAYSAYISESNGDNREHYRNGILRCYRIIRQIAEKKEWLNPPGAVS
jgi:flagellar protein FlgJ